MEGAVSRRVEVPRLAVILLGFLHRLGFVVRGTPRSALSYYRYLLAILHSLVCLCMENARHFFANSAQFLKTDKMKT